jgi:hypothetical protein
MLGLLAHGLHLLLVTLGLAGVGALLLPQLRQARLSGRSTFRPPATLEEHEERVAALRTAVRAGQLTALPAAERELPPWPDERDPSSWRAIAAASSLAAAVVHAAVFPHHLEESVVVGAFFFVVAAWQAAWSFRLSRRVTPGLLITGLTASLGLIGLWAVSRTTGLPLGLGREPVGAWDLAAVAWQLCVAMGCVAGLRGSSTDHGLPLGRLTVATWGWVLSSAAVLLLLTLTVSHG